MAVAVRLQVEGLNLDDEATVAAIDEHLANALWMESDGRITATYFPDSDDDVVNEVLRFARCIESRVHGAKVKQVDRDLVNVSDIAHRTGFSRETVRKWAERPVGAFPMPFNSVGEGKHSKIWLWSDVAEWLNGVYQLDIAVDWPTRAQLAHIDALLANSARIGSIRLDIANRVATNADELSKFSCAT